MKQQKVYVITAEGGPTKVGISHQPAARRTSLQAQYRGQPLTIAHVVDVGDAAAAAVEKKAHELLDASRAHGEWFNVTAQEAIEAIDLAIEAVRAAEPVTAGRVHWHLRLTIDEDVKLRAIERAKAERRTTPNYVAALIEKDQQAERDSK